MDEQLLGKKQKGKGEGERRMLFLIADTHFWGGKKKGGGSKTLESCCLFLPASVRSVFERRIKTHFVLCEDLYSLLNIPPEPKFKAEGRRGGGEVGFFFFLHMCTYGDGSDRRGSRIKNTGRDWKKKKKTGKSYLKQVASLRQLLSARSAKK